MQNGVSVIVCCHNSGKRLPDTLRHLAAQEVANNLNWEVIIVDNNSTDNTSSIAENVWNEFNLKATLRVVSEYKPGLSAAREKGIQESIFDFLIFCDDDNWLQPNYINNAYDLLINNSSIAAVGGINIGAFDLAPPDWFNAFASSFAIGKQGEGAFQILEGANFLFGAGLAFKKAAFELIKKNGFRFYLTDRIGRKVIGGGDVELCYLFKLVGYNIAFSSNLILQHYMPLSRINKKYLANMWHQYPASWLVFEAYKIFLENQFRVEVLSSSYWRKRVIHRIRSICKKLPLYFDNRLNGNVHKYLPFETEFRYHVYLLLNIKTLLSIINDLHYKLK